MGRGFKLPRGIDAPRVEEFPRGDETSRVTPKGDRVPGADGRWQGRDRNSPATRDTGGSDNNSRVEKMANGQEPEAPQSPKRGMEEGRIGEMRPHRHPGGANGATPKHGAPACRK